MDAERIGSRLYAKVREVASVEPLGRERPAWQSYLWFLGVTVGGCLVILGLVWLSMTGVLRGSVGIWVFLAAVFGLPWLLLPLALKHERQKAKPVVAAPVEVPEGALPCVCISGSSLIEHRSAGWLYIRGSWLVFKGETFDFRLQKDDFHRPQGIASRICNRTGSRSFKLAAIDGELQLWLAILFSDPLIRPNAAFARFKEDLTQWEDRDRSSEESVYPPLKPLPTFEETRIKIRWAGLLFLGSIPFLVIVSFAAFAGLAMIRSAFPEMEMVPSPAKFLQGIGMLAFVMPGMYLFCAGMFYAIAVIWRRPLERKVASMEAAKIDP